MGCPRSPTPLSQDRTGQQTTQKVQGQNLAKETRPFSSQNKEIETETETGPEETSPESKVI